MSIITKRMMYTIQIGGKDHALSDWEVGELKRELTDENDWRRAADDGRLIDAIKVVRSLTGCGLKEGKDAVELYRKEFPSQTKAADQYLAKVRGYTEEGQDDDSRTPPPPENENDYNDDIPF